MTVGLRLAGPEDLEFIVACRNDEVSVRWSDSRAPVTPEMMQGRLTEADVLTRIGLIEAAPIGYAYLTPTPIRSSHGIACVREVTCYVVSLALAPAWRGHGLAVPFLRALLREANTYRIEAVYALIDPDNVASLKTFTRAGFRQVQIPWPAAREDLTVWVA